MAEGGEELPGLDPAGLNEPKDNGDVDRENMEMDPISSTTHLIDPAEKEVETSFGGRNYGMEGVRPKLPGEKYDKRTLAFEKLKERFPYFNPIYSPFSAIIEDSGGVWVTLTSKSNNVPHLIIKPNGDLVNLDPLPAQIKTALGIDSITLITRNSELITQLNEKNEEKRELRSILNEKNEEIIDLKNALVGLSAVNERETQSHILNNKEKRRIIEQHESTIEELESHLATAVDQKIVSKTEAVELKFELNKTKNELEKYKKGKSNLTMLERSNDRLQAEVDKFQELTRKSMIYNQEQIANLESKNEEILKNLPLYSKSMVLQFLLF